ncbi:hypothetical protein AAHH78_35100, partial [Burkholderia pseudomallei]
CVLVVLLVVMEFGPILGDRVLACRSAVIFSYGYILVVFFWVSGRFWFCWVRRGRSPGIAFSYIVSMVAGLM